jgi:hypothetical protein
LRIAVLNCGIERRDGMAYQVRSVIVSHMQLECSVSQLLVRVILQANEIFESFRADTEHWKKIAGGRKVKQLTLQHLLVFAVQYISTALIHTHSVAVTVQGPTQVTSCCNLLAPVRQLCSNGASKRTSFFTSAKSVHCRTLPGISFSLNLAE